MSMRKSIMALIVLASLVSMPAFARAKVKRAKPSSDQLKAIRVAAKAYKLDISDLVKIATMEGNWDSMATRINKNWTVDFGLFQINSVHWNDECKEFDVMGLKGNSMCAAKLFAIAKKHARHDPHWKGRYHSKTPTLKKHYAEKIEKTIIALR